MTGPLPAVWLSIYDASNPARGIHCEPISGTDALRQAYKYASIGLRLLRYIPPA